MRTDISPAGIGWRISSLCDANGGSCVEAGLLPDGSGRVAIRQSTDPDGPIVLFTNEEWTAFVAGVQKGEFDFLS